MEYGIRDGTDENTPDEDRFFQVFGDPAYGVSRQIMSPFAVPRERTEAEQDWNNAMPAVRIEVEHGFDDVTPVWPFVNAW